MSKPAYETGFDDEEVPRSNPIRVCMETFIAFARKYEGVLKRLIESSLETQSVVDFEAKIKEFVDYDEIELTLVDIKKLVVLFRLMSFEIGELPQTKNANLIQDELKKLLKSFFELKGDPETEIKKLLNFNSICIPYCGHEILLSKDELDFVKSTLKGMLEEVRKEIPFSDVIQMATQVRECTEEVIKTA